jgi:hypothetical protein
MSPFGFVRTRYLCNTTYLGLRRTFADIATPIDAGGADGFNTRAPPVRNLSIGDILVGDLAQILLDPRHARIELQIFEINTASFRYRIGRNFTVRRVKVTPNVSSRKMYGRTRRVNGGCCFRQQFGSTVSTMHYMNTK